MNDQQIHQLYRDLLTKPLFPQNKAAADAIGSFMGNRGERLRLLNVGRSGEAHALWLEMREQAEKLQHLINSGEIVLKEGAL